MGPRLPEDEHARFVAKQWLDRYGVVFREWWERERPPVGWRAIYRELKRMELRGEVRRGYFVGGLSGAQFATSAAVEQLRGHAEQTRALVLTKGDPAAATSLVHTGALSHC